MSEIKSEVTEISKSAEHIYNFLADFNNFEKLMPEQVKNWSSTTDTCSFEISGIGKIMLKITEKTPFTKIVMVPDAGTRIPFTFELISDLKSTSDNSTQALMMINADMPMMISMMASKPLQNLVNILAAKLKEYMEK
jgi:hypothetical protein